MKDKNWASLLAYVTGLVNQKLLLLVAPSEGAIMAAP